MDVPEPEFEDEYEDGEREQFPPEELEAEEER